jgi:hypothetical protein
MPDLQQNDLSPRLQSLLNLVDLGKRMSHMSSFLTVIHTMTTYYKRIPQSFNFYFTGRHFLGQSCGTGAYQPLNIISRFILYIMLKCKWFVSKLKTLAFSFYWMKGSVSYSTVRDFKSEASSTVHVQLYKSPIFKHILSWKNTFIVADR